MSFISFLSSCIFLCFRPLVLVLCLHFLRFGFSSCTREILELFLQNTWVFHRPSTGRRHCWRHACCACPGFFDLLNFDFSENFCWKKVFWNCYLWTTNLLIEPWILWHWFFHLKRIWLSCTFSLIWNCLAYSFRRAKSEKETKELFRAVFLDPTLLYLSIWSRNRWSLFLHTGEDWMLNFSNAIKTWPSVAWKFCCNALRTKLTHPHSPLTILTVWIFGWEPWLKSWLFVCFQELRLPRWCNPYLGGTIDWVKCYPHRAVTPITSCCSRSCGCCCGCYCRCSGWSHRCGRSNWWWR